MNVRLEVVVVQIFTQIMFVVIIPQRGIFHALLISVALSGIAGTSLRHDNSSSKTSCKKKCISFTMPPAFTKGDSSQALSTYFTKCLLDGEECDVDFGQFIKPLKDLPTNEFFLGILCKSRTLLKLVNPHNVLKSNVVSFFQLAGECRTAVESVSRFGVATDYRVQLFTRRATLLAENITRIAEIQGLRNIGTLSLESSQPTGIPDIFTRFEWPKMAEVALFNLSIERLPVTLKQRMPRLQTLELNNNSLTEPPDFPWDERHLELPQNLTRKAVFNHHYQQGAMVLPNLYRRFFSLDYNNIRDLSRHQFKGFLQKLSLKANGLETVGPQCFTNVTGMNILDLSHNKLSSIPNGLFSGKGLMLELRLEHNNLTSLPALAFRGMKSLKRLYLHSNRLDEVPRGLLRTNEELTEVTLHNNNIVDVGEDAIPENSNTLTTLKLNNNRLYRIPQAVFLLRNLATADLSFNNLNFSGLLDVLDSIGIEKLMYNLRESASEMASPMKLKTRRVSLNLASNNIRTIELEHLNKTQLFKVKAIFEVYEINLRNNPLHCDCTTLGLMKILKDLIKEHAHIKYDRFDTWICATPRRLRGQPLLRISEHEFVCVMDMENCPRGCICARRGIDGHILVNCNRKRFRWLPEKMPSGWLEISLHDNAIEELGWREYLSYITVLKLSYNNIRGLNDTFLDSLSNVTILNIDNNKLKRLPFGVKRLTGRANFQSLSIHHNYFICDCKALWLKAWINNHTDKIMDINNVLCASGKLEGKPISKAPDELFICPVAAPLLYHKNPVPAVFAIALGVMLGLAIAVFILTYRFRFEMKIFVYTHFNWHPFDRVDDSDDTKIYDAFISYSSHDRRWVKETLRDSLENHNPPYRLCLHDRDFEIGASIHENILYSVNRSKRMIMVLSNDFIKSEWCMVEFRAAHHKVLQDKTNYLIIILFDDVDTELLDEETKLYLRTNTYLSVSNKWFWQKLFYALPEPRGAEDNIITPPDLVSLEVAPPRLSKEALMGLSVGSCPGTKRLHADSNV